MDSLTISYKKKIASILIVLLAFLPNHNTQAQENGIPSLILRRNSINMYVGVWDYNLNYERNIFQRPKSYTNIRIGFGKDESYLDGYYFIPSLVHLFGRKNSHLEIDLGCKVLTSPVTADGTSFLPDVFVGYRHEKPAGRFMFRAGINPTTIYNVGIGVKF